MISTKGSEISPCAYIYHGVCEVDLTNTNDVSITLTKSTKFGEVPSSHSDLKNKKNKHKFIKVMTDCVQLPVMVFLRDTIVEGSNVSRGII